ncbi:uncharacterized protein Dwil_GK27418 [Drosophila willistoni]|uniref:Uncharacterized protein n=1 Tax=Drosophila willistoni TaxID=7260 RepID=A0A0Q9WVS4_DROWI|nr:uncharacterized protein LOC26529420 [Drosophila willistoni]KRF97476.1 uncharacterized protein Dwil_GK27418 [Drosophila willistoni]
MAESDQPVTAIESSSSSPPVLNISGRVINVPRLPRINKKKKKTFKPDTTINPNTFPAILSKILLKSDEPPNSPPNNYTSDVYSEYVCVAIFINNSTRMRVHHMFCSNSKDWRKDFERVRKLYEKQKDLQSRNQVSVATVCSRSLYRSAQKDLKEYKWNREGNVFEIPLELGTDEWLRSRLQNLQQIEMEKLFNYIKFLSINKQ